MSFDTRTVLMNLVQCETEAEVTAVVNRYPALRNKQNWQPYGGNRNNYSTIGSQQAHPTNALIELIINSVDAMLIRGCYEEGISASDPKAPRNMVEAAERFYGVTDGRLEDLSEARRSSLAENIRVIATGKKPPNYPSLTIVDLGEGQPPLAFPKTFLSLDSQNKIRNHFVQGTFNVGSTGVLQFCGSTHKYKLILSRRHPSLRQGDDDALWGFTLIRRAPPEEGVKLSYFEYFAPGGEVPTIDAGQLPVLPGRSSLPYESPLEWGTLIKLYEYRIPQRTIITIDLWYELNARLQRLALPVRLHELRPFRSHTPEIVLAGMHTRIASDRALIESDFPVAFHLNVPRIGKLEVRATLFRQFNSDSQRRHWLRNDCVFFTRNGQAHASLDRRFLERKSVGLDYLSRELMVTVDCSDIDTTIRDDLFMTSRDRLREGEWKSLLEEALAEELRKHPTLREWNFRRREESIRERVADNSTAIEVFAKLVRDVPTIAELLGVGKGFRGPLDPPRRASKFQGAKFPNKLELKKGKSGEYVKDCPINSRTCYVDCETDASNDYLTRPDSPGYFLEPEEAFHSYHGPWNGGFRVYLAPPSNAKVGDRFAVKFGFMDDSRFEPLEVLLTLNICDPQEKRKTPPSPPPKLNLPNTIHVYKNEWDQHGMDRKSAVVIKQGASDEVDIYINMDNRFLLQELSLLDSKGNEELVKKQFSVAMAVIGLSLYQNERDGEGGTENSGDYREAASAVARVIMPIMRTLGTSTAMFLKRAS